MKISFVIPAYNEEKAIGHCLRSVLEEAKKGDYEMEITVVNNAGTDNTRQAALAFPGIRVIDEPRKGTSQARQTGFLASSGDLIANIDADTRLTPGWIDKVFREFSADPDLVAFSGPFIYYDLSRLERMAVKFFYFLGYLVYLVNHKILKKGAMLQGGNFVLRRSALEKVGGYDTSFTFYGDDTEIAAKISKVGRVKFSFKFQIYTSGRRLKQEGIVRMGMRYALNHIWTLIFKRPFTVKVKEIKK
jgi:glycosyltransferase involved in cell wall biosynthesis